MRLIHITDPHLSKLGKHTFASLRGKRRTGYLSWTHKRYFIHRRETLEQLIAAVRAESADQLILSGDLVQIGLEDEIRQAGDWLAELAPAQQIFLVPGNHDVYAKDSWANLRRHWNFVLPAAPNGFADGPDSPYPKVRDFGRLRLIGVSSARVTPVFSARGALGHAQFDRLARLLQESREQGFLCGLVIHHPPLPGMAKWRKALKEVRALQSLIAAQQPAVVFCGHLHHNLDLAEGASRVFCTASASSVQSASYRLLDIEPAGQHWNIRMQLKSIAAAGGTSSAAFEVVHEQRWTVTSSPPFEAHAACGAHQGTGHTQPPPAPPPPGS
ncbi:MAG TPA: metallophosphoesterase [Xanthomonadales bacterium]|nr:metallophosphoesterase [Xanthomonadales bacterium]